MKSKLLGLIALLAILFSCTDSGKYGEEIIGFWRLKSITFQGQTIPVESSEFSMSVEFKSDGTWNGTSTGPEVPTGSGTYAITGSTLSMRETGITAFSTKLSKLTPSEMVWNVDIEGDGGKFNFERQVMN